MAEEPKEGIRLGDQLPQENDREVVRWLLSYLGRYRLHTAVVYLLVLVTAVAGFAVLPFMKLVMDSVQSLGASQRVFDRQLGASILGRLFVGWEPIDVITTAAGLLLVVKLAQALLASANQYLNDVLTGKIGRDMRADLFRHVIELPEDYAAEHPVGELTARFTQNLNASIAIFTTVFFFPIVSLSTLVISSVYVLTLDPLLGAIALAFGPLYYFVVGPLGKAIAKKVQGVSHHFTAVNQDLQETLSATKEIKANASEARERAEFAGNIDEHYRAMLALSRWNLLAGQLMKLLTEAAPIVMLAAGAVLIVRGGGVTLGTLMVVFGFVPTLLGAMSSVSSVKLSYVNAVAFARENWQILQEAREADLLGGTEELSIPDPLDPKQPIIEFEHLTMAYPRSQYRVSDMSFKIYPGQSVAIIGAGGSGKSTVFNVLFKLYDYQAGSARVFGQELRSLTIASLRGAFGLMNQFPFFFQRSFRENVLYGIDARDPTAEAKMKALCAELGMDEVVASMPQGYDTELVNRGANLSGSQQKRAALVRALMRDPRVLLLDEPLSGLSPDQRREVSASIQRLAGRMTILVITHDLELIRDMDHILVFERRDRAPAAGAPLGGTPIAGMPMPGTVVAKGTVLPKGAVVAKGVAAGPKGGAKVPGKAAQVPEALQEGFLVAQGTYAELSQSSPVFRTLVGMEPPSA